MPVDPTPVAMDAVEGCAWSIVHTADGKKFYFNSQSKVNEFYVIIFNIIIDSNLLNCRN